MSNKVNESIEINITQSKDQEQNSEQPTSRIIEVGKFYFIHDKSKSGHPGLVVWKDDKANRYLVVKFDSDKFGVKTKREKGTKHITELKYPISNKIKNSYVKNRPFLCKRKDIGHIMPDLVLHPKDLVIIDTVKSKNPELSSSLSKNKKPHRWTY